jgi:hypothetical protein
MLPESGTKNAIDFGKGSLPVTPSAKTAAEGSRVCCADYNPGRKTMAMAFVRKIKYVKSKLTKPCNQQEENLRVAVGNCNHRAESKIAATGRNFEQAFSQSAAIPVKFSAAVAICRWVCGRWSVFWHAQKSHQALEHAAAVARPKISLRPAETPGNRPVLRIKIVSATPPSIARRLNLKQVRIT